MLEVDIDKILPLTEARDNFNKIIDDVGGTEHMYVLTKNGKPSAVVVGVNHLEKLTGKSADELTSMVEKKADQTPVVEEVIHQLAGPNRQHPNQWPLDSLSSPAQVRRHRRHLKFRQKLRLRSRRTLGLLRQLAENHHRPRLTAGRLYRHRHRAVCLPRVQSRGQSRKSLPIKRQRRRIRQPAERPPATATYLSNNPTKAH